MSEKQIDDYINGLEEKNAIYVDKELEYADKCHELEEELGISVEEMATILKAIKPNVNYRSLYDDDNNEYLHIWQENGYADDPLLGTSIEDTKLNNALKKFFKRSRYE